MRNAGRQRQGNRPDQMALIRSCRRDPTVDQIHLASIDQQSLPDLIIDQISNLFLRVSVIFSFRGGLLSKYPLFVSPNFLVIEDPIDQ